MTTEQYMRTDEIKAKQSQKMMRHLSSEYQKQILKGIIVMIIGLIIITVGTVGTYMTTVLPFFGFALMGLGFAIIFFTVRLIAGSGEVRTE